MFQELNKRSLMVEEAIEDIIILVQKMSFQKSLDYQNSFTDGGLDGESHSACIETKLELF